jgi:hypothetical protein
VCQDFGPAGVAVGGEAVVSIGHGLVVVVTVGIGVCSSSLLYVLEAENAIVRAAA